EPALPERGSLSLRARRRDGARIPRHVALISHGYFQKYQTWTKNTKVSRTVANRTRREVATTNFPPPVRLHPRGGRGMSERQFAVLGRWALAADSLQWMLQRRSGQGGSRYRS